MRSRSHSKKDVIEGRACTVTDQFLFKLCSLLQQSLQLLTLLLVEWLATGIISARSWLLRIVVAILGSHIRH